MHEFSIAQNIVNIALKTGAENKAERILAVEVEIGKAAGVETDALLFAWESAIKDTLLSEARLDIVSVPVEVMCRNCSYQYKPEEIFEFCPKCGGINPEIIKGRELRITAITV